MKTGDIKYHLEMNKNRSYLYKIKLLILTDNYNYGYWRVKYTEKVFDFMNRGDEDMVDMEEIINSRDLFNTIKDAIDAMSISPYGMQPENIIKRLLI